MQRAAVVLYYWADQPVQEIARTLAVSESTVKQHLFRARGRLAELLREEVGEDVG
jgi:RNA polymerase sigma-70 factor (ECF subfamily)